ncbi:GreA/GreB family elongation factor [Neolewinella antarctica]|nr:GreA/GreB family elongation factor [Neolewinella antarctica]
MELTRTQQATKDAIVKQITKMKQESLDNIMKMQRMDNQEAKKETEDGMNMFEDGKVDQARNRVTARSSVADALAQDINLLKGINTITPTEEIQMGDVVHTDKGKFFVACASDAFTIEGEKYIGISTESPLFRALLGKHDGDTVTVNGNDFKLKKSF